VRRARHALSTLLVALGACAQPEEQAQIGGRPALPANEEHPHDSAQVEGASPFTRWPTSEQPSGLRAGTLLAIRETRRVEGVETETSELRVRWNEVDAEGLGLAAELVVQREQRGRGAELRSTPNEGRRFAIAMRNGSLRLLSGVEPSFTDETDRQPALFARALASGGHGALRPDEPRAIGETWSVPLGRYLAEAGLAGAPTFEGTVRAQRLADREALVAIAFDVELQTPERFRRDAHLALRGEVLFDPRRGLAVAKRSAGVLREEGRSFPIEVETLVEVLFEAAVADEVGPVGR
jgi:hypothetical protein